MKARSYNNQFSKTPKPAAVFALLILSGCASASLEPAGTLSSYENLEKSDGLTTHGSVYMDADKLSAAKTVRIIPTRFAQTPATATFSEEQKKLIANSISRTMCMRLGSAFKVVKPQDTADLTLHVVIASATLTNAVAAGMSKIAGVVPKILLPTVQVPVPRLPIGLGSLSAEAEVTDAKGVQVASMTWARGADSFTTPGRASQDGDAYDLAQSFSDDMTKLLINHINPIRPTTTVTLPDVGAMMKQIGVKPNDANCAIYGRNPGIMGQIGGAVGAPPSWTDKGEAPATDMQSQHPAP